MERHGEAWFGSFTNYPVGRGGAYFHFPGSILVSRTMRPLVDASLDDASLDDASLRRRIALIYCTTIRSGL